MNLERSVAARGSALNVQLTPRMAGVVALVAAVAGLGCLAITGKGLLSSGIGLATLAVAAGVASWSRAGSRGTSSPAAIAPAEPDVGGDAGTLLLAGEWPEVTFGDVCGETECKQELLDLVDFLRHPEKYSRVGARMPKGVILVGPPGTGKTLMARALAGEAQVPFFYCAGSEFVEVYAGVGARRVRELFRTAASHAPAVVFIDEIDAVGRRRGSGVGNSHDEREQTLNEILTQLDGFKINQGVLVLAATNRSDVLDPALLRPGRFDRKVRVDLPDIEARISILDHFLRDKPGAGSLPLPRLARQTTGFSGADLENLVNEASVLTARRGLDTVGIAELEESIERLMLGSTRRVRALAPREREIVAYHEAGHAVAMLHLEDIPIPHKVTILGRGSSLGYTLSFMEEERTLNSESQYRDDLVALLAGRAAERMKLDQVTTSAAGDLERATRLAHSMVSKYGMSEGFGALTLAESTAGDSDGRPSAASAEVTSTLYREVQRLLAEAEARATEILLAAERELDAVAMALRERETLSGEELQQVVSRATGEPVGSELLL